MPSETTNYCGAAKMTGEKHKRGLFVDIETSDGSLKSSPSSSKSHHSGKRAVNEESESTESSEEEDEEDYEKLRQRNIEQRMKLVRSLGIFDIKEKLDTKSKKEHAKKKPPTPRKKSERIRVQEDTKRKRSGGGGRGRASKRIKQEEVMSDLLTGERFTVESARKKSGPLPMVSIKSEDEEDEDEATARCSEFVTLLRPFLVHKGDESQLATCSLDGFKKIISNIKLAPDMIAKTNTSRITSIAFHPGQEKLLVASGSVSGDLGLWDVYNQDEEKCVEVFGPHARQINCLSFDRYNPTKILSTSLDGTVRRGDLMKMVFDEVWAHEQLGGKCHATWHHQSNEHELWIAHGDGTVITVDSRTPMRRVAQYQCHDRSVRTVQTHPREDFYFVTASALGQVRIWDRRKIKKNTEPVWDLVHSKGLTSAFFSHLGNLLLTTCNDDRLRVFHTAHLPGACKPKVVTNIRHNVHTGQYVSVFKATWHPQREDVFMIGSLDKAKKLQIYGIHGQPIHSITSSNLTTIPAVNAWHPTLPIIASGNASGKVHVFMK